MARERGRRFPDAVTAYSALMAAIDKLADETAPANATAD